MEAIEDRTIAFLREQVEAIEDEDDLLFELEVLDSPYALITKAYGVSVDDGDSDFAPTPGAEDVEEFDGRLTLVVYSRVDGPNYEDRKASRTRAVNCAAKLAMLFLIDPTMNDRVNDSRVLRCLRGWANYSSEPYAIANVPLIVNETGASSDAR
jgi:hypothetical protein